MSLMPGPCLICVYAIRNIQHWYDMRCYAYELSIPALSIHIEWHSRSHFVGGAWELLCAQTHAQACIPNCWICWRLSWGNVYRFVPLRCSVFRQENERFGRCKDERRIQVNGKSVCLSKEQRMKCNLCVFKLAFCSVRFFLGHPARF